MNVLYLGDIFGKPGREIARDCLPGMVEREKLDVCFANAENSSGGA
ncbi:MAG: YmdB family metallophosphoesterase, partial [Deltaproteobacteria bacterium]|nr:YmdB family metallophosphoesterase [Deltaproteobacteria bacterium]